MKRAWCGVVSGLAFVSVSTPFALVSADDGVADFTGDRSSGIIVNHSTNPSSSAVHTVNVFDLVGEIRPATGVEGIYFENKIGGNVLINSGASEETVSIVTTGSADGITGIAQGAPQGPFPLNSFLNVSLLGVDPDVPGGRVDITSFSNILTDGTGARGISANSASAGYPDSVVQNLKDFQETGFTFEVTEVKNTDGQTEVFDANGKATVRGFRLDENGNVMTTAQGAVIEFGTIVIAKTGGFTVSFSDEEKALFEGLGIDDEVTLGVNYTVLGNRAGNHQSDDGNLVVVVTRDEDGDLVERRTSAFFDTFGVSEKPALADSPNVFPDLKAYVDSVVADATAGGTGGSVNVKNYGVIETKKEESHGIYAYSVGGQGAGGRGGNISHSAGAGFAGKSPGEVSVLADGQIITHGDESNGIIAMSAGGVGGPGGNGGCFRHGATGGTGGDGGLVTVTGNAEITTEGDYSSGIVAYSVGGNGGGGGSGKGAMPGGNGGYGGRGGTVNVDGDWDITTGGDEEHVASGDKAHGIWAKSLGGNAGNGGSGGWLWGDPGHGGQATDGGQVSLSSGGEIVTDGLSSYGLYAQSVGGFGGKGGSTWGLFVSFGGDGNSGGSGGAVDVINKEDGMITTWGQYSHAIIAQSIGGGGGSGGGQSVNIVSLGGEGASGGNGGTVDVENNGGIATKEIGSYGILAQSVGGGGGDGGSVGGLIALGGSGSKTSNGGDVTVTNNGSISTEGDISHAIFAESIGGGGGSGGRGGGLIAVGGKGGSGGNAGNVTVINTGSLFTKKKESYGIFAQSVGGGGGSGGGAVSISGGVGVSVGGQGAAGGIAKKVVVESLADSSIATQGERSYGIFAQSVGGGGGDGGFAITAGLGSLVSVAVGGSAGTGGNADTVDVTMDGTLTTDGDQSYGILAQSVGGGGGTGGFAIAGSYGGAGINVNLGLGGSGGVGGEAKAVTVNMAGSIDTKGERAHGILAQSVGGGGGDGGFAVAGSIAGGTSVNLAFGGEGGNATKGGEVNVTTTGSVTTNDNDAHGIVAQSIGGSGGNGGFSIAASIAGGASVGLAFGGNGGEGSSGGAVHVGSALEPVEGLITTYGDRSYGILAQSLGGGGGNGGASIAGDLLGPGAITLGFGGEGGSGSTGGAVDVYNDSFIHAFGLQSHGIFAQSVGGGGGNGGLSITGGVTAFGGLALAMGGEGGSANSGGEVTVVNSGKIQTEDEYSYGIFAQSIGGKGGAGGSSGSVMANFSSLIPIPPEYPTGSLNVSLSLGGDGGTGGAAGRVDVTNSGIITTQGENSYGIFAQSVGGGGGDGGKAVAVTANISLPEDPGAGEEKPQLEVKVDFAMALGGDGGVANHGNEVDVFNTGAIETFGIGAHGIFAQSVGGGGGSGGDARSMILSIDPSNWNESDPPPDPASISAGATISIGGEGAAAGDGGIVSVTNDGMIITHAADAFGIFAQSVGGGGGIGGGGYHGLDWQDFGVPEEYEPLADLLPIQDEGDVHVAVGGRGGNSGLGKDVSIENNGFITTYGAGSIGVLAQSVGGGGGIGGSGVTGGDGTITVGGGGTGGAAGGGGTIDIDHFGDITTYGTVAHGIFAQSVGGGGGFGGNVDKGITGFGINLAMAGSGGKGGDGGDVLIDSAGDITTYGNGAIGIYAQSVAGGGGLRGEIGAGFGFAGSAGGTGDAGVVEVVHRGNITTYGENAHGIFAQSVGGADFGGEVHVTIAGDIAVYGEGARAFIAQSEGASGKKNIDVIYESGTITGGGSSAIGFFEGIQNTFTNYGTVTTITGVHGNAISGTTGNDTVHNHGDLFGSIDLGTGLNGFINYAGAVLNSGGTIDLGSGATFENHGIFSPGGSGIFTTTGVNANLSQLVSSVFEMDLDLRSGQSDLIHVAGNADVNGTTRINIVNIGYATPGTVTTTLVTSDGGITNSGLLLQEKQSAVMAYHLLFSEGNAIQLEATMNAAPQGLSPAQMKMGQYINMIQTAGTPGFVPFATELFNLSDVESLGAAYEQLSPAAYGLFTDSTINSSGHYSSSLVKRMHSVRLAVQDQDETRKIAQVQPNALWAEQINYFADQEERSGIPGYTSSTGGIVIGYDYLLSKSFLLGGSVGYTNTGINITDSAGDGGIDSSFGSFYGSMFDKKWYVDFGLSFGDHNYDNHREVNVGAISGYAMSEHDGDMWSTFVESGYNLVAEKWLLQPFVSMRYASLEEDSYQERGMEGANLLMDEHQTESLVMNMGVRFSLPFTIDDWTFIPDVKVAWNHDFDVDRERITAGFDSAPAYKCEMESADNEKDGVILGVGITTISKNHVSLSLNYSGEFRDQYMAHALIGGVRVEF